MTNSTVAALAKGNGNTAAAAAKAAAFQNTRSYQALKNDPNGSHFKTALTKNNMDTAMTDVQQEKRFCFVAKISFTPKTQTTTQNGHTIDIPNPTVQHLKSFVRNVSLAFPQAIVFKTFSTKTEIDLNRFFCTW